MSGIFENALLVPVSKPVTTRFKTFSPVGAVDNIASQNKFSDLREKTGVGFTAGCFARQGNAKTRSPQENTWRKSASKNVMTYVPLALSLLPFAVAVLSCRKMNLSKIELGDMTYATKGIWQILSGSANHYLKRCTPFEISITDAAMSYTKGKSLPIENVTLLKASLNGVPKDIPNRLHNVFVNQVFKFRSKVRAQSHAYMLLDKVIGTVTFKDYMADPLSHFGRLMKTSEFDDIMEAVLAMNRAGIVHGDIAAHKNILLFLNPQTKKLNASLIDFELGRLNGKSDTHIQIDLYDDYDDLMIIKNELLRTGTLV